jgi:Uncharacterized protein conserved in bacteria
MNSIDEALPLLQQILTLIEKQFGSMCEVVLHDLTKDYNHTIVDIRNGNVTNRTIGGCGSNLGLEVLRGTVVDGDRFNYVTTTQDGKILRSSSIYLKNDAGEVIASVCINLNITDTLKLEGYLHNFNQFETISNDEYFAADVNNLLSHLIQTGQEMIGKPAGDMNKSEKIDFIHFLDEKGAFLITKSSEQICELLGISKFTFYNYLETSRNHTEGNSETTL